MKLKDPVTGEEYRILHHRSGLELRIAEMPAFRTASAQIAVKFGSTDIAFRKAPDTPVRRMPPGIAHYLEHKLFENEACNASELFAAVGARDNAYTDTDRTVYYFRSFRAFPEALRILLEMVQKPYFTKKNVDRERGIILQELQEALDDPADALTMQLLDGIYHQHPCRYHILGTAESIREITPELLYECWQSFYRLDRMALCCAGNVNTEEILKIADAVLPEQAGTPFCAELIQPDEPESIRAPKLRRKMPLGRTQFMIGFKLPPAEGEALLRESLLCMLVLELLAGDTAPLYLRLLDDGLLHDALAIDTMSGKGWFTVTAEGESDDPEAVLEALCGELEKARTQGLDAERFAVCKRAAYGDLLLSLNSPDAVADAMTESFLLGIADHFTQLRLLRELQPSDAEDCLRRCFDKDHICLSVIEPEETE